MRRAIDSPGELEKEIEVAKTFLAAAVEILEKRGPMHYQELTDAIISGGLAESSSATPSASLNAMLAVDIKQKGSESTFVRIKPGVFGLRRLHASAARPAPPDEGVSATEGNGEEQRVRVPLFPAYSEVRHVMKVWQGRPRKHVTGLRAAINELRGTPQNNVDWSEPAVWIPERLEGEVRDLASAIWDVSGGAVNPRHTYGHWLLALKYELVKDGANGLLELTEKGRDFLENPEGETEAAIDEAEGLIKLLAIVADNGPARTGGLYEDWVEYLKRRSPFGTDSTYKDTLRRRLNNLRDRGLVERKGRLYSATPAGLAYLERVGNEDSVGGGEQPEIWGLVRQQETTVRESLREVLLEMDPIAFEHLVKRLLEEMDYQNVEVTSPSGDGGVDVVADIELGITSVREVVQAKRHRRTIQRKDLDALRGSLYRFNAVRGTIITTARFSSGTVDAAFATGAAPITLIDGEKLIDLLIEHGIGVRKRTVELLEVDPEDLAPTDEEA